jgi:hypothetical protein
MAIKTNVDPQAAFAGREAKANAATGEVPERIRQHAPKPVHRPGGSWAGLADAVDQRVREAHDAAKAQAEWAARIRTGRRRGRGMGMAFRRSADNE